MIYNEKKTVLKLFFLISLLSKIIALHQPVFSKKLVELVKKNDGNKMTITDSDLVACGKDDCQKIKQFSISNNHAFNCNENSVGIEFEIKHHNSSKVLSSGYLLEGLNNVIADLQVSGLFCKRIKRYIDKYF